MLQLSIDRAQMRFIATSLLRMSLTIVTSSNHQPTLRFKRLPIPTIPLALVKEGVHHVEIYIQWMLDKVITYAMRSLNGILEYWCINLPLSTTEVDGDTRLQSNDKIQKIHIQICSQVQKKIVLSAFPQHFHNNIAATLINSEVSIGCPILHMSHKELDLGSTKARRCCLAVHKKNLTRKAIFE